MKAKHSPLHFFGLLAVFFLGSSLLSITAEERQFRLDGFVIGCSGKHPVHISLYGANIFKDGEPIATQIQKPLNQAKCQVPFNFETNTGDYTISVFEDENGNGKLDFFMGPSEPSGFYHEFTAWRAPTFEDIKFKLDTDIVGVKINLN